MFCSSGVRTLSVFARRFYCAHRGMPRKCRRDTFTRLLAPIIHRVSANFVRSLAVAAPYSQNSHEFRYTECAAHATADE